MKKLILVFIVVLIGTTPLTPGLAQDYDCDAQMDQLDAALANVLTLLTNGDSDEALIRVIEAQQLLQKIRQNCGFDSVENDNGEDDNGDDKDDNDQLTAQISTGNNTNANVRDTPPVGSVLGSLPNESAISIREKANCADAGMWWLIDFEDGVGWVNDNLVTISGDTSLVPQNDDACTDSQPTCMIIANFNSNSNVNNLYGGMGPACPIDCQDPNAEDRLIPYFADDVAQLEYRINNWSAFWLNLNGADFSDYTWLVFDIRSGGLLPNQIKVELKRANSTEWVSAYIPGVTQQWQTKSIKLDALQPTGFSGTTGITAWTDMEELAFTFEVHIAGNNGIVFLDNVLVCP